jgi:hypothetical protein
MKKQLQFKSSQNVNVLRLLVGLIAFIAVHSSPLFKFSFYLFSSPISLANNATPDEKSLVSKEKSLIDDLKIFKLEVPPFRVDAPQNIRTQSSSIQLRLLSETPNQITDNEAWFERNNLSLPTYQVPNDWNNISGNIPDRIPPVFKNNILVSAIRDRDRDFLIYGDDFGDSKYLFVYDLKQQKFTLGYDFSNYLFSPTYQDSGDRNYINQTLNWIVPEGDILYFSHSHNTYAKSSNGMNAYLTALNTKTNRIIWRSQPLVCNAANFVIIDDVIICGYGFTSEPDYLYLINKNTGDLLQQIKLNTAPEYIIRKQDKLYIRSYDTDYIFEIK